MFENKANEEDEESNHDNTDNELHESQDEEAQETQKKSKRDVSLADIKFVTSSMLLAILYIALNLDRSEIQLSHLIQFVREGRLSVYNCFKFIPKELSVKLIPNYNHFVNSTKYAYHGGCAPAKIRQVAMTLFKHLDLGVPLVPDLNKIMDNYIQELCLPKDFKDLVLSLTSLMPCDFLELDAPSMYYSVRTPDYESVCMSYVLLALKMCFGLDCDYEIKLSDAVEKINADGDYLKCYKLGIYTEPTDRLFSFREWYMFIQFRKMVLSKYYLPLASQFHLPTDDGVFIEQMDQRKTQKLKLSYDVAMDILNKIPSDNTRVIPKEEFPVTLTPMSIYTDVIKESIEDPNLKLRLCEDFTQYSLKYATKDLTLPGCSLKGVDDINKIIKPFLSVGTVSTLKGDTNIVLVRNCDNKNWLKTRPPEKKHVTIINRNNNGYDSTNKLSPETENDESEAEDEDSSHDSNEEMCDVIEEDEELSIFDDDFKNMKIDEDDKKDANLTDVEETEFVLRFNNSNLNNSTTNLHDTYSNVDSIPEMVFDPKTFDREKVIQELIEIVCKKFKIRIPVEKVDRKPIKRKIPKSSETGVSEPKKKKTVNRMKTGEAAKITQGIIDAYYDTLNNDLLLKVSEHVKTAIETAAIQAICNITDDALNNQTEEIDAQNQNNAENSQNEILRDDTNVLDNSQNASIQENDTSDALAISAIGDDDGEYNIDELLPKCEPEFDPTTHDIKQLYVSFNNEDFNDFDIGVPDNDADINDMLDKKIEQLRNNSENDKHLHGNDNKGDTSESNESDNELHDNIEFEQESFMRKTDTSSLEYLIQNRDIKMFRYWMKHYKSQNYRSRNINQKFNVELAENSPRSFYFVITECAEISNCSTISLYKKLNYLENTILSLLK